MTSLQHVRRILLILVSSLAFVLVVSTGSASAQTLIGTVGPGYSITFRTAAGAPVRFVATGRTYTLVIRDLSIGHNFRLSGPGVGRLTTVPYRGEKRSTVVFRNGVYNYNCDPHALSMYGSFRSRTV